MFLRYLANQGNFYNFWYLPILACYSFWTTLFVLYHAFAPWEAWGLWEVKKTRMIQAFPTLVNNYMNFSFMCWLRVQCMLSKKA